MKKRLFFTGPIGCGKSTAIASALGDRISQCGGFLTRRYRQSHLHFTLESPDGRMKETFLDFSDGIPHLKSQIFEDLGPEWWQGKILLLDEIGGVELLCPGFMAALESALNSDIPIIGVVKGEAPASKLVMALGLSEEYEKAANLLRTRLREDGDTLVYTCSQFDENALLLAQNWVKEYCP